MHALPHTHAARLAVVARLGDGVAFFAGLAARGVDRAVAAVARRAGFVLAGRVAHGAARLAVRARLLHGVAVVALLVGRIGRPVAALVGDACAFVAVLVADRAALVGVVAALGHRVAVVALFLGVFVDHAVAAVGLGDFLARGVAGAAVLIAVLAALDVGVAVVALLARALLDSRRRRSCAPWRSRCCSGRRRSRCRRRRSLRRPRGRCRRQWRTLHRPRTPSRPRSHSADRSRRLRRRCRRRTLRRSSTSPSPQPSGAALPPAPACSPPAPAAAPPAPPAPDWPVPAEPDAPGARSTRARTVLPVAIAAAAGRSGRAHVAAVIAAADAQPGHRQQTDRRPSPHARKAIHAHDHPSLPKRQARVEHGATHVTRRTRKQTWDSHPHRVERVAARASRARGPPRRRGRRPRRCRAAPSILPVSASSLAMVVTMRAPVAPNGWPIAIEPPCTLSLSSRPRPRPRCARAARARSRGSPSILSTREHLRRERLVHVDEVDVGELTCPALSSALGMRERRARSAAGPPGRRRRTPSVRSAASGLKPSACAFSSLISNGAAAPSVSGLALPAVIVPSCREHGRAAWRASPRWCRRARGCRRAPSRLADLHLGRPRGRSGRWRCARAARWCERTASSSCASREISLRLAMRSAASPITSPVVRSAIFGTRGRMSVSGISCASAPR